MHWLRAQQEDSDPGLAPLIDVVLLLLIFFMVTTSFRTPRFELELPEAENTTTASDTPLQVVEVDAAGVITHDGEAVSLEALGDRLRAGVKEDTAADRETALEVRADRATPHGTVVEVLDVARGASITNVALAVEARSEEP